MHGRDRGHAPEGAAPITRRLLTPRDCVFATCLPLDKKEFLRAKRTEERRDFVRYECRHWTDYDRFISTFARDAVAEYERLGVRVERGATLATLRRLTASDERPVVVLFSHWTGAGVEFDEGLVPFEAVAAAVSVTFSGILDLCVCQPTPLALLLRATRPDCVVKLKSTRLRPGPWFDFYLGVFSALAEQPATYPDVLSRVADAFGLPSDEHATKEEL